MAALSDRADRAVKNVFGAGRGAPSPEEEEIFTSITPKKAFKKSIMARARRIRERNQKT